MKIRSEQEMLALGEKFAKELKAPQIIELIGDVGAGKTTFVRGLAKGLDIKKHITSPSFTISKSYALKNGGRLIHYDFYRLQDPGLMSEDLQENLTNPKNIIIIEWGNSVKDLLPKNRTIISFTKNDDDSRKIIVKNSRTALSGDGSLAPVVTGLAPSFSVVTSESPREALLRLFLDTSSPKTILRINNKEYKYVFDNDLAEKLLKFIHDKLQENKKDFKDISEITFMSGPGSFTGLRIGASIVNTLAHELNIPLYDHHGKKHQVIIPNYGREANISKPKK